MKFTLIEPPKGEEDNFVFESESGDVTLTIHESCGFSLAWIDFKGESIRCENQKELMEGIKKIEGFKQ